MKNTHAKTHSNYTVDIVQIFKVSREGEDERFKKVNNASPQRNMVIAIYFILYKYLTALIVFTVVSIC